VSAPASKSAALDLVAAIVLRALERAEAKKPAA
jgi:hypothetical protein